MDKPNEGIESAVPAAVPGQRSFDYLVVGAGFAGSVMAERLARGLNLRVLLVDKRAHIGGSAYDRLDDAGVLIQPYGPRIFHTDSAEVFDYLSQFTAWRPCRDDRCLAGAFQAMPLHGYTRMFERMLAHPNINVMLNTDYRTLVDVLPWRHMVYTGPMGAFSNPANATSYGRHESDAVALSVVPGAGRPAPDKDCDMDQVVGQALATFKRLRQRQPVALPTA